MLSPLAHLQAEYKVAADALLGNDVLHGAERRSQVGVEELRGQQTHGGGHQVVWQGHICDLKTEEKKILERSSAHNLYTNKKHMDLAVLVKRVK